MPARGHRTGHASLNVRSGLGIVADDVRWTGLGDRNALDHARVGALERYAIMLPLPRQCAGMMLDVVPLELTW